MTRASTVESSGVLSGSQFTSTTVEANSRSMTVVRALATWRGPACGSAGRITQSSRCRSASRWEASTTQSTPVSDVPAPGAAVAAITSVTSVPSGNSSSAPSAREHHGARETASSTGSGASRSRWAGTSMRPACRATSRAKPARSGAQPPTTAMTSTGSTRPPWVVLAAAARTTSGVSRDAPPRVPGA
ncbi:hypothetical protein [Kocuria tytonis]|uniref:hypothetical protein n=1 Tax=Kocuria tytonis TaxID=2054280 RepID=UPI001F33A908|nr:hypothetical protein [Kocuria tytonis]